MKSRLAAAVAAVWAVAYVCFYLLLIRQQEDSGPAWWYVVLVLAGAAAALLWAITGRRRPAVIVAAVLLGIATLLGLLTVGMFLLPGLAAAVVAAIGSSTHPAAATGAG